MAVIADCLHACAGSGSRRDGRYLFSALAVAQTNHRKNAVLIHNVISIRSDRFRDLPKKFGDLIVATPYVMRICPMPKWAATTSQVLGFGIWHRRPKLTHSFLGNAADAFY